MRILLIATLPARALDHRVPPFAIEHYCTRMRGLEYDKFGGNRRQVSARLVRNRSIPILVRKQRQHRVTYFPFLLAACRLWSACIFADAAALKLRIV
eukprot:369281-Pleurochrysis_carterae.AAC.1